MDSKIPKVSVIIPTYNCAKYLPEAIESVLNQTYKDYEIIIVDDGSTDNTKEVLDEYLKGVGFRVSGVGENGRNTQYARRDTDSNRYTLIAIRYYYQENKGPAAARNKGIKEARGEFISFLDADDIWASEKLEKDSNILDRDRDEDIGLVCSLMCRLNINNKELMGIKPKYKPGTNFHKLLINGSAAPSTFTIRKSCLESVGLFDSNIVGMEDLDLCFRIVLRYKIFFINKVLGKYRLHDNNISGDEEKINLAYIKTYRKVFKKARYAGDVRLSKKKLAKYYYLLGKLYFSERKYIDATKNIRKAISVCNWLGANFIKDRDPIVKRILILMKPYFAFSFSFLLAILEKTKKRYKNERGIINILFYEPSSGFGGSANSLANLLIHLDKYRFKPVAVICNEGPQFEKIEDTEKIKIKSYSYPTGSSKFNVGIHFIRDIIPQAVKLYFIIKSRKISLVHINTNIMSGVSAIIASKIAGIPCVCHIRGTRKLIKRERIFAKWVDKFIVLNKDAYELYRKDISEKKLGIIYNSIDIDGFQVNELASLRVRDEFGLNCHLVVGVIGRIVKGKGQKEFILSAKEVFKVKPEVKFLIVGDAKGDNDEYYKEVKELVKRERLDRNIIFTGWRNDAKEIISNLDILVQPSTVPEGFGLTIIEAMTLRKPVIATDIPGPRDIVINGETGFLVPPADIKAMADKIIYLLDNPEISKKMGEKGRKRVKECFDVRRAVKEIEKVYEEFNA